MIRSALLRQVHEALSEAPAVALLGECEGLVVVDEVQRLPSLFEMLRPICDAADRKAGPRTPVLGAS